MPVLQKAKKTDKSDDLIFFKCHFAGRLREKAQAIFSSQSSVLFYKKVRELFALLLAK